LLRYLFESISSSILQPLHYACAYAYGATEDVLYVLTDLYPTGIVTTDRRGRTPLLFALSNASRNTSPAAVRLLLSLNRNIVDSVNGGLSPLRVLAGFSLGVGDDKTEREAVGRCLELLLLAEPSPTADFFTALQSLPDWLQDQAVVMPVVQNLLNVKIAQRFPSSVLMSDFYFQVLVIVFYSMNVPEAVDRRFNEFGENYQERIDTKYLIPLYIGATYFLLREVIQVLSLMGLKSFHIWFYDLSNWLNVVYIFLVYFWTVRMQLNNGNDQFFRTGAALSAIILWLKLLGYLRNMLIEFSVFVGGVFHVLKRLAAFLLALSIILIAFSQMFYTLYRFECLGLSVQTTREQTLAEIQCGRLEKNMYCNRWTSFLDTFTMLLGEVDGDQFLDSGVAIALFIVFMFLVVILLAVSTRVLVLNLTRIDSPSYECLTGRRL
jgi:hypothetical protein